MPEYTDVHGVEIVYDLATPVTTPRGVIHLLHGVGEHAGRYGAVIGALTDAGFIVYADDHRGHGRTGMRQHGSSERLGRLGPGGLRATIDAVWQLSEMARAEHPDLPFILLGHSWGSFIAQILVNGGILVYHLPSGIEHTLLAVTSAIGVLFVYSAINRSVATPRPRPLVLVRRSEAAR